MLSKNILLEAIYNKTGIYITTKNDCKIISQLIVDEKVGYLSESTIYRFFLYDKSSNKPYKNTFTILAKFCGYRDWNSFLNYYNSNLIFNDSRFLDNSIESIINGFISNKKFNLLIEIFETLYHENYKTKDFYGLKAFLQFQKTDYFNEFIKSYGDNLFVRNILIESLYDPEHRIIGYTEGIENYLRLTSAKSKYYIQDSVFALSVLFRHYFLNNKSKALEVGKKLYNGEFLLTIDSDIHIFPKARYFAYKLWYNEIINLGNHNNEEYFSFIKEWIHYELLKTDSINNLNIMFNTLIEVLQKISNSILEIEITEMFESKLNQKNLTLIEFKKMKNPNGILNIFPLY